MLRCYAALRNLPPGSVLYADKAHNDYEIEDPRSSQGSASASLQIIQPYWRKRVETAGSLLMGAFPKSLYAVSPFKPVGIL